MQFRYLRKLYWYNCYDIDVLCESAWEETKYRMILISRIPVTSRFTYIFIEHYNFYTARGLKY